MVLGIKEFSKEFMENGGKNGGGFGEWLDIFCGGLWGIAGIPPIKWPKNTSFYQKIGDKRVLPAFIGGISLRLVEVQQIRWEN